VGWTPGCAPAPRETDSDSGSQTGGGAHYVSHKWASGLLSATAIESKVLLCGTKRRFISRIQRIGETISRTS